MDQQLPAVDIHMVTTTFTLDGFRIERNLGIVRGIIVRSRSILGTVGRQPADAGWGRHYAFQQSV